MVPYMCWHRYVQVGLVLLSMIVIIYLVQCFGLIDLRKVLCFRACLGRPREHVSSSKPSGSDLNSTGDSTHTDNLESFKDFGVEAR